MTESMKEPVDLTDEIHEVNDHECNLLNIFLGLIKKEEIINNHSNMNINISLNELQHNILTQMLDKEIIDLDEKTNNDKSKLIIRVVDNSYGENTKTKIELTLFLINYYETEIELKKIEKNQQQEDTKLKTNNYKSALSEIQTLSSDGSITESRIAKEFKLKLYDKKNPALITKLRLIIVISLILLIAMECIIDIDR